MDQLYRSIAIVLLASLALNSQSREKRITPVQPSQRLNFERQAKVAVLAGVAHYPSRSGLTSLQYPAHDVDLVEAALTKQNYKVVKLQDSEATRGSVEQALKDAAALVDGGQGTVIFFFSGHGFVDHGANYLATFEATRTELAATGLAVSRVEELMKATGAPRQVLFIDACRNQGTKSTETRSFDKFRSSEGMAALFSTRTGSVSFEDSRIGSGVFTHFLVKGLQGEAADADGFITFRDLADYVTDGVSDYGFKTGQMQVPFEAGEHRGDFLLASRTVKPAPTVVIAPDYPSRLAYPAALSTPLGVKTKINPKDGLTYVWIPPGQFAMGCSPGDKFCFYGDQSMHPVSVTRGFWMGQTETTQTAYQQVTGENPSRFHGETYGESLPVEQVTWQQAQHYCQAVGMRLPTEEEWEYAARAGSTEPTYGPLDQIAWYQDNSRNRTHGVGQKQPNAFGLYDILGNVWEWLANPGAVRGGSMQDSPQIIRVSNRVPQSTVIRFYNMGLRCVGE